MGPGRPEGLTLLTGASGLLGAALVGEARRRGLPFRATARTERIPWHGGERVHADLTAPGAVERLLAGGVTAVVHAAAAADVDWCEAHPDEARRVNAELPATLARTARREGIALVHVSTDAVFDGERGHYGEEDPPGPKTVYGRTKREGEIAVLAEHPGALVARTNFVGWSPSGRRGLFDWVIVALREGREVPGFSDVVFTPLSVGGLAAALLDLVAARISGVLHVAGSEAVTKLEFARRVAAAFGLDGGRVVPRTLAAANLRAPRPRNLSLRVSRAEGLLGAKLENVDRILARLRDEERSGFVRDLREGG